MYIQLCYDHTRFIVFEESLSISTIMHAQREIETLHEKITSLNTQMGDKHIEELKQSLKGN